MNVVSMMNTFSRTEMVVLTHIKIIIVVTIVIMIVVIVIVVNIIESSTLPSSS